MSDTTIGKCFKDTIYFIEWKKNDQYTFYTMSITGANQLAYIILPIILEEGDIL